MRLLHFHPVPIMLILAAPAGAVAASDAGVTSVASIAAVILWLSALGWGFHAMLHHRLAAEDRLAQLENDVVCERDARAAQAAATRHTMGVLAEEWRSLEACLVDGDTRSVPARMHAVQTCIAQLQQTA